MKQMINTSIGCSNSKCSQKSYCQIYHLRNASPVSQHCEFIQQTVHTFAAIYKWIISLEKLLIQGKAEGKQRKGRPPKDWMDDIKERTGLTAVGATRLTDDRKMWSALLVATPAHMR